MGGVMIAPRIGQWNGHVFEVSPYVVRGFTGLTIKGASDTKDKKKKKQKLVSRKAGNPKEITLTVGLNAFTNCDVRDEALQFVDEAVAGAKGYFYTGNKKLVNCQLMLTEASVEETEIAVGGTWVSCKVKLTLKQCGKDGKVEKEGKTKERKLKPNKTSIKKKSWVRSMTEKGADDSSENDTDVSRAVSEANRMIDEAKAASKASKSASKKGANPTISKGKNRIKPL